MSPGSTAAAAALLVWFASANKLSRERDDSIMELKGRSVLQTVEVVLTAHPTQVMRRSLQHKQCRVGQLLQELDRVSANSTSSDELLRALFREVMATWQTDELRRNKPTPVEEAKGAHPA